MSVVELGVLVLSCLFFLGSLDDLFLDIVHAVFALKPKKISNDKWSEWNIREEDPIAVMIPAKEIPYVVRKGNIWYFADSPMSYTHYEDRYFILADLLWDILEETPPSKRIALARFEDIAPNTNVDYLRWGIDFMNSKKAPFSLAVIPQFVDLIGVNERQAVTNESIEKYPRLVQAIRYATRRGGSIIMHGVSHALGNVISGYDGLTGSDYEFWLYPENTPLPFDSVDWFTKRIERGIDVFNRLGLKPSAFEVPHYAASVMNYLVLGKMFHWNYHRTVYFPYKVIQDTGLPENLMAFTCDPEKCGEERRALLNNIQVEVDYHSFGGVPVPYIIYKDPYGQSIIPETLGMIDFAFYGPKTWRPVSRPEDIIRRAKKLKVIRGAIASFFWHPQLLDQRFRYYVDFWTELDAIGIDMYRSLGSKNETYPPNYVMLVDQLQLRTDEYASQVDIALAEIQGITDKLQPMIFKEVGYRSVDEGFIDPFSYETGAGNYNEEHQAAAFEAIFKSFWEPRFDWFQGASFWDVSVNPVRNSGRGDTGFSPIGKKKTVDVLKMIYSFQ